MWRNLPLSLRLIAALLIVHVAVVTAVTLWLTRSEAAARLAELRLHLDALNDGIEAAISNGPGGPQLDQGSQEVKERLDDPNLYFLIQTADGILVAESRGPSADVRKALAERFTLHAKEAPAYEVTWPTGIWLAQSEPHLTTRVNVAINEEPLLANLASFRHKVLAGAFFLLFATSLGSGLVVSLTTRNLRRFALRLRTLKPSDDVTGVDIIPQCAEERLLFESHLSLLRKVRSLFTAQRLFIANAAHELKTPITAARAALETTLSRRRTPEDYEETCRDVLVEVTNLQRLSHSLLDLSLLDAGPASALGKSCVGALVARQVLSRWTKAAADRGVTTHMVDDAASPEAILLGEADHWEVVLGNFVDNAVKYGRASGHLWVKFQVVDRTRVHITIEDDGLGMSAAHLERLGEVFFRGDAARTGSQSFGIGFAHAKRLVERLGGTVSVSSREGHGTTVTIEAPRG